MEGKGVRAQLPAGEARIHAVHDPHAFYIVSTWQRIASRCIKSNRQGGEGKTGKAATTRKSVAAYHQRPDPLQGLSSR